LQVEPWASRQCSAAHDRDDTTCAEIVPYHWHVSCLNFLQPGLISSALAPMGSVRSAVVASTPWRTAPSNALRRRCPASRRLERARLTTPGVRWGADGFGPARTPLVLDRSCRCGQGIAFRRACNRRAPRSCCRQSVTSALDFAPAVCRIHCASLSLQNSERTGFGTVDVGLARGRQSRQFPQCGESQLDVGHSEWRAVNTIRLSSSRPPPVVTKRSNKDAGRSLGTPGISLRAARCV
jgi:hypothetical protein